MLKLFYILLRSLEPFSPLFRIKTWYLSPLWVMNKQCVVTGYFTSNHFFLILNTRDDIWCLEKFSNPPSPRSLLCLYYGLDSIFLFSLPACTIWCSLAMWNHFLHLPTIFNLMLTVNSLIAVIICFKFDKTYHIPNLVSLCIIGHLALLIWSFWLKHFSSFHCSWK